MAKINKRPRKTGAKKTPARRRGLKPGKPKDSGVTVAPDGAEQMKVLLRLAPEDRQLLTEIRRRMRVASNKKAIVRTLTEVKRFMTLQKKGYKLAMVKGDDIKAVQVFF